MTYCEAAPQVLISAERPLTIREISDPAVEPGLMTPVRKTPQQSMGARLYTQSRNDSELIRLEDPGNGRAKRGSVRWTLRRAQATVLEGSGPRQIDRGDWTGSVDHGNQ